MGSNEAPLNQYSYTDSLYLNMPNSGLNSSFMMSAKKLLAHTALINAWLIEELYFEWQLQGISSINLRYLNKFVQ